MSTDTTPAPIGADALRAVIAEMRSKEARGAEATEHELGEMADRLTQALDQYDAALASAAPQPAVQQGDAEDAARLDWLLGEGRSMAIDSCDGEYRVVDAKWGLVVTDWMPTPRAAIDAARAAKEGA